MSGKTLREIFFLTSVNHMKAICFLTVKPNKMFCDFCEKLKNESYDIFICVDNNSHIIEESDKYEIIKINNEECENAGFKNTVTYCKNKACSRDKALYYFSVINTYYEHVWFIEEDVFIPTIHTILDIDTKYPTADLLCKSKNKQNQRWFHHNRVCKEIGSDTYFFSLICATRMSKELINIIKKYAEDNKTLYFCEALYTTLAHNNNLSTLCIDELQTIEYTCNQIPLNLMLTKMTIAKNLYHAVKNIDHQHQIRQTNFSE